MLRESHSKRELPGIDVEQASQLMMRQTEERSVTGVQRQPDGAPMWTSRQRLSEDGDVGVVAAEKPLVDGLLQSPDERGGGSRCSGSQAPAHASVAVQSGRSDAPVSTTAIRSPGSEWR